MLDFRIDTFIAVCKHLNFTKAAEELNITQPAVSQHIKYLQNSYQVTLFAHNGKKISLTKEGEILLNVATTLKHDDIFLRHKLQQGGLHKQRLVFGTTLTVGQYVILDKVASYMKQHPTTTIKLTIDNTKKILQGINEGNIDFGMIEGYFPKNEYDYIVYAKESYIAICGKEYVLHPGTYTIEELFKERIILREVESGSRDILERYLLERNYAVEDFRDCLEINNIQAILRLVEEDCGISFVYRKAVEKELEKGNIQEIPMQDMHLMHDITFLWRKNSIFANEYRHVFEELVKE